MLEMLKRNRRQPSCPPSLDELGVSADSPVGRIHVKFPEITAIYAYKKDCFVTDQIRLIVSNGEWDIEFTEDDISLDDFSAALEKHLDVPPVWVHNMITSPVFKTTWTAVYPIEPSKCEALTCD